MRRKIDKWFEAHTDEMITDLGRLIAINSERGPAAEGAPYGDGPRAALTLARSMLEEYGFEVSDFEDIIITSDTGPAPPFMGILAHLDTVGTGDGWNTDPHKMMVIDGKIYGRGSTDNKGPSVAAMYAMRCARELCPDMQRGFRLLLGSGEETGCEDIDYYLSKAEPPPNVFTPDADYPVVNTEKGRITPFFAASWDDETSSPGKEKALPRVISVTGGNTINVVPNRAEAVIKGFTIAEVEGFCREYSKKTGAAFSARKNGNDSGQLTIIAEGASSHAASPHLGLNAQTAMLEMLAAMPFAETAGFGYIRALNRLFPHGDYRGRAIGIAMGDETTGELTVNFGVLRFSEIELAGNFDSRTPACADDADLPGITRAALEREGIKMTNLTVSRCHHTPEDSPFVQRLLRIYEEYTGEPGLCLAVGGQTYAHNIPGGVAFGVGVPGIDNKIHGANEHINMDQLLLSAKMFTRAILDMCG